MSGTFAGIVENPRKTQYWVTQSTKGWTITKRKPKGRRPWGPFTTKEKAKEAIQQLYNLVNPAKKNPSEYNRGYADGKAAKQFNFRRGTSKNLKGASADYINGYVDGYKQRKPAKKNPIAIYNPPTKQKLLYGRAYIPVIRGIKTNGKYRGEKYEHKFSKNEVSIYGNPDGSLIVKSNNNLRLWNYDKDI